MLKNESQDLIKLTVEQMHEGIQILDFNWVYVYLNSAAARHGRSDSEKLIGRKLTDAFPGIEKTYAFSIMSEVMETREMRQVENEFVYADGGKCWFELFVEPHPAGILIRSIDISSRKKIEEQYLYSQKLESVGRLAGGIAHDFNNKLGIMMLYCEMALGTEAASEPDLHRYIENILTAVEQAAALTKQLLAFGRKQVLDLRVLNLNDVIGTAIENLKKMVGENIEIKHYFERDLGKVKIDRSQIEQVLLNLVVNSCDSISKNGVITIETANAELDKEYASRHPNVSPGPYVMFSVSDNGSGMSPEVRDKIFEPFFTTKEFGKGTGLGLASVHGIINQSHGHIWVYSEQGIGTSFKIYFPRVTEPADAVEKPIAEMKTKGNGERVLLVEDDPLLREAFVQTLSAAGYFVTAAGTAEDAEKIFTEGQNSYDLLLTDVVLPKMNGNELATKLRALKPDLKFAFMSGYTENSIVHHGVLDTDSVLIQKPITTQKLLTTVRLILDTNLKKSLV